MIKRYIITAAELGARPNHKQLDAYDTYAAMNDAKVIIIPMEGQYRDGNLHDRFMDYKIASQMDLGKNVSIKDFRVKAQGINPLTGLRRFGAVDKSIIVGSPKQHLEHVANSNKNNPKAVMSTGACTLPNYKEHLRIGRIALEDHIQGAVLLDVDTKSGLFYFRQIQNTTDGSFIDYGNKYMPNGNVHDVRADTIVLGDIHEAQLDEANYEASCDMINNLKPKYVVLHDLFDAYSVTHHDQGRNLLRAKKANLGNLSLQDELYSLGKRIEELCAQGSKDTQYIVVKSNHDEHLDRYLDECRFTGDAANLQLSVKLANAMLEGKDPVEEGIKLTYGSIPKNIKFLQRDDDFNRYGWHLSSHGDKGPSGSRGSLASFEYSLGKAIVAHSHSAAIRKNVFRVGALERTDVDYAKGSAGAWTATNAVIYSNRKAELLSIYGGEWRL